MTPREPIRSIEVFHRDFTWAQPTTLSGGRVLTASDHTFVRVTTDGGLAGWGEIALPGATYIEAFGEGVRAGLGVLCPELIGVCALQRGVVAERAAHTLKGQAPVLSAIDMAMWDIAGHRFGVPVCQLLGGRMNAQLPMVLPIPPHAPHEVAARIVAGRAAGYRQFAPRLTGELARDITCARAVADVVVPRDLVSLDANGGYPLADASRLVGALRGAPIVWEQPCATARACALLRQRTGTPMALDEAVGGPGDLLDAIAAGALDLWVLKIGKVGGLTTAKLMVDICANAGIGVWVEDCAGTEIAGAAVCHVATAAAPNALQGVWYLPTFMDEAVVSTDAVVDRGTVRLAGSRPGLGVEVDVGSLGTRVQIHGLL